MQAEDLTLMGREESEVCFQSAAGCKHISFFYNTFGAEVFHYHGDFFCLCQRLSYGNSIFAKKVKQSIMQVSIFSNVFSATPQETSLESIVCAVKCSDRLSELTSKIRAYLQRDSKEKANKIKKGSIPAFMPAAQVMGGKGHDNIVALTGLCFIDIDKVSQEEIAKLRVLASEDEHVLMVKQSVSGNGVHILLRYTVQNSRLMAICGLAPREMKNKYIKISKAIHHYYRGKFNLKLDKSATNPCQLCILSADKDVYYNSLAKPLIYDDTTKALIL